MQEREKEEGLLELASQDRLGGRAGRVGVGGRGRGRALALIQQHVSFFSFLVSVVCVCGTMLLLCAMY